MGFISRNIEQSLVSEVEKVTALPSFGNVSRVVYLTAGATGIYQDNGAAWVKLLVSADLYTLNNYFVIKTLADFPAPVSGVITLANNVTYQINGTIEIGTNQIKRGVSNIIFGLDKSDDKLIYTGSSDMFIDGANQDITIRDITITADTAGSKVFNWTGTTNKVELHGIIFGGCRDLGSCTGAALLVFRNNLCTSNYNGILFNTIGDLAVVDNYFIDNLSTHSGVSLGATTFETVLISRNHIESLTTQTAININTSIVVTSAVLSTNLFEGAGAYLTGINHTQANWSFNNNVGIANKLVELIFTSNDISGIALSTPTTAAAGNSTITSTGSRFTTFRGGTNQDDGAGFTFQVPQDYFSGGYFEIVGTNNTTALNVKIFMGISTVAEGDNFATLDESPLSVVFAGVTAYNRKTAIITPITTVFMAGNVIVVKVWRDPDDAQDTAATEYYLNNIQFVYNGK